jgi:hypothetical protein
VKWFTLRAKLLDFRDFRNWHFLTHSRSERRLRCFDRRCVIGRIEQMEREEQRGSCDCHPWAIAAPSKYMLFKAVAKATMMRLLQSGAT